MSFGTIVRGGLLVSLLALSACMPSLPPYVEPSPANGAYATLRASQRLGWMHLFNRGGGTAMPYRIDGKQLDTQKVMTDGGIVVAPGTHTVRMGLTRMGSHWFSGSSTESTSVDMAMEFVAGRRYRVCMEPALGPDAHPFQAAVWVEEDGIQPPGPYVTVVLPRVKGALLMREVEDDGLSATCK